MKTSALLLVSCFISTPVFSNEPVRYTLPEVPTTVTNGVEYKCLNAPQWQHVILIASDYQALYDLRIKMQATIDLSDQLNLSWQLAVKNRDAQIKVLKEDRDYLTLRLNQSIKTQEKDSRSLKLEKGVMWGVIALQSILLLVIGIKGAVR
jgi:hypothetical protein